MMRSYNALLATFVVASLASTGIQADYGRINRYLVAHVDTDEVGPNMEAASNWLKEKGGNKLALLSTTPVSGLKQFTALQQVMGSPKCDRTEYEIMLLNESAVDLYDLVFEKRVNRRVDKVMHEIFKDHAEKCHQVYIDEFRSKELDSVVVERVTNITETILEKKRFIIPTRIFYSPQYLFDEYVVQALTIDDCTGLDYLKAAIEFSAKGDPDVKYLVRIPDELTGKAVVHVDKIKDLVKKYLIEPCKAFVAELAPVFVPARFDAKFYNQLDDSNQDYYLSWVSFMICKALTEHEAAVFADVILSAKRDLNSIITG